MPERSPHREELLAAAARNGDLVREDAAAAERAGTLTPRVVAALRESRLFDAFLAKELGGLEADALTLLELVEAVARHDGSAGWCLGMGGVIAGLAASRLPEAGAREVFGSGERVLCAGGFVPRLEALRKAGGYRVSGRFPFASGCRHAQWLVVTGMVAGDPGPGAMRTFCVPREEVEILDNWHVAGLEGTASNDLELRDVRVPEERTFAPLVGAPERGAADWRAPLLSVAGIGHLGFALGVPRRALEEAAAAATRQRFGSASRTAERPVFQSDYARAHVRLRAARLAAREAFREVLDAAPAPTLEQRAELSLAVAHAYATATDVAEFAFRAGGASSLYRGGALQRCFRDVQAGAQHVVASEEAFERAGQALLGVGEPGFL